MNRKNFESFIGRPVEIFLAPITYKTSGILVKCEEDHVVIGDELWSYAAILGVRPQPKSVDSVPTVKNKESAKPNENSSDNSDLNEPEAKPDNTDVLKAMELEGREFSGTLTSFFYERGLWGFIESEEVKKTGVPLRDGEKVFVHMNQITDEILKQKLMQERNPEPKIDVVFKLTQNQHGVAASDVREKAHDKVLTVDVASAVYEEGEIDYFRRYDEIPHGEIRVKGGALYRFDESDVIDPLLAVFLECSPSAEGQPVKFIKSAGTKGRMKAANISASKPFPDEKIKDWEKSGLIQKAKERMGITD